MTWNILFAVIVDRLTPHKHILECLNFYWRLRVLFPCIFFHWPSESVGEVRSVQKKTHKYYIVIFLITGEKIELVQRIHDEKLKSSHPNPNLPVLVIKVFHFHSASDLAKEATLCDGTCWPAWRFSFLSLVHRGRRRCRKKENRPYYAFHLWYSWSIYERNVFFIN